MKRKFRLTRSVDFKRVRRDGKSIANPLMVLIITNNLQGDTRIGLVTSKRVGGAVERNRARRRLRACFDDLLPLLKPGHDLMIIARQPISRATWPELKAALLNVLQRGVLLEKGEERTSGCFA